ncbi:hypothetical protein [Actinoplanes sp. ATCC 53533]|nr:hypothetical protein [Actinoplanes sp. ATCC 53533]
MEPVALILSIEMTRREARSALPHARVRPPSARWRRVRATVRGVIGPAER